MEKRAVGLFCGVILLFTGLFYRTSYLSAGDGLAQVARSQSTYVLEVAQTRGMIYDRAFRPLVNTGTGRRAAVLPGPANLQAVRKLLPDRAEFLQRVQDGRPFAARVDAGFPEDGGAAVFEVPERYGGSPAAVHILGHLQDGAGAYGLEQVFDDFLQANGGALELRYPVDATGRALSEAPEVLDTLAQSRRGVVLTLDERIQRVAEYAAKKSLTRGAVVVLDCNTGDILASVSLPEFDPADPGASFDEADSPFVNKAFAAFNVGSSFKLVDIAAALENGVEPGAVECTGSVDVDGQVFRCNNHAGHGWVDLRRGLQVSCNPYFIQLAQQVGAENLREMAARLGFGRACVLAEGYQSAAGSLPDPDELRNPADVANFGFGQGALLATPLQIARMVSVFANGGLLVSPRLVEGYSDADGSALEVELPRYEANRVVSEETAARVRELMISVVEEGSGRNAKPARGGAGGKTASAQTGRYYADARAGEIVQAWFAGFFPAGEPRYAVAVLAEGADSGSAYAAPVFADIADGILALEEAAENDQ